MTEEMKLIGEKAKKASRTLLTLNSRTKKEMLYKMAEFLIKECQYIIEENKGGSTVAKYSSKINKIRTFALSLIFIGFIIMYGGIFFRNSPLIMTIFYSII